MVSLSWVPRGNFPCIQTTLRWDISCHFLSITKEAKLWFVPAVLVLATYVLSCFFLIYCSYFGHEVYICCSSVHWITNLWIVKSVFPSQREFDSSIHDCSWLSKYSNYRWRVWSSVFFMQTDKVMFIFLQHCESDFCWSFYLLFLSWRWMDPCNALFLDFRLKWILDRSIPAKIISVKDYCSDEYLVHQRM